MSMHEVVYTYKYTLSFSRCVYLLPPLVPDASTPDAFSLHRNSTCQQVVRLIVLRPSSVAIIYTTKQLATRRHAVPS